MMLSVQDYLGPGEEVPSLPTIFHQINEAVNNPRSSMRDIAEIISTDQGLSARLLRLVNSAFFGFPSKIETISHAVTIIGIKQLRDLALATTVLEMFKDIPAELISARNFWRHSLACGIAARLLSSYLQEPNVERLFVAGLLHDIGRLLMYRRASEQAKTALLRCKENSELLFEVERELLGFDHSDLGGALLNHWRLPKSLEEAVKHHHRPQRARSYPMEANITHVADIFANAMKLGTSGERYVPPLHAAAWDSFGIPVSVLSPAAQLMDKQYGEAVYLFLEDKN